MLFIVKNNLNILFKHTKQKDKLKLKDIYRDSCELCPPAVYMCVKRAEHSKIVLKEYEKS